MKRIFLLTFLVFQISTSTSTLRAQITESAKEAVKNMGVGWNLGNTLDASDSKVADFNLDAYWGGQGLDSETYWGQPVTSPALFKMMKNAGFGAIRVPVTWYNHMDKSGKVSAEWMKRVRTVVDYVLDNGLYCILNVHHDTGADSNSHKSWIKADESNYNANKTRFEELWKQIAEEFKDYGKHLLFEGYNEMLDVKSSWCFASFSGTYSATQAASAYKGLNGYAQSFVNTVRATGGNNATRNLVVNTYAAANGYGTWNSHLKDVLTQMALPEDKVEGHIIFEVHDYPNIANSNNGVVTDRSLADIKSQVNGTINGLNTYLVSKGAPVIIGEWGTSNVDSGAGKTDYDVRRGLMLQFAEYYVQQCKANDIATFYWMGMTDGKYRSVPAFSQPDLAKTITKAYHGTSFQGEYPELDAMSEIVVFEGDKMISGWGVSVKIDATDFQQIGKDVQLLINYKQESSGGDIQLYYGDWSSKPSFTVDGKAKMSGDLNPGEYYGTPSGTEHTTVFTFDETTYKALISKGLIVFGDGWRMKQMKLINPTSGIELPQMVEGCKSSGIYTLSGQRVTSLVRGIYIKDGKKVLVK